MATDLSFVEYIVDQLHPACTVTFKKMFGEYAIYYSGKVVALACDNRLFVKPTPGGLAFAGDIPMAPAYPGAKPSLLVDDQIDDGDWLVRLITITAQELPMPKPKKKKSLRDSVPR